MSNPDDHQTTSEEMITAVRSFQRLVGWIGSVTGTVLAAGLVFLISTMLTMQTDIAVMKAANTQQNKDNEQSRAIYQQNAVEIQQIKLRLLTLEIMTQKKGDQP